jgi:hypothetical protein
MQEVSAERNTNADLESTRDLMIRIVHAECHRRLRTDQNLKTGMCMLGILAFDGGRCRVLQIVVTALNLPRGLLRTWTKTVCTLVMGVPLSEYKSGSSSHLSSHKLRCWQGFDPLSETICMLESYDSTYRGCTFK